MTGIDFRSGEEIETTALAIESAIIRLRGAIISARGKRLEYIAAVLEGGRALLELRKHVHDGEWEKRVKAEGMEVWTAWNWRRLAELGKTPQQILDGGGMSQVLRKHKRDKPPKVQEECGHAWMLIASSGKCSECECEKLPRRDKDIDRRTTVASAPSEALGQADPEMTVGALGAPHFREFNGEGLIHRFELCHITISQSAERVLDAVL